MAKIEKIGELPGGYEKDRRVYSDEGICPSIPATSAEKVKIKPKVIGNLPGFEMTHRVYGTETVSPALRTFVSGGG